MLLSNFDRWSAKLLQTDNGPTWLSYDVVNGKVRWRCLLCHTIEQRRKASGFKIKFDALKRHELQTSHLNAVGLHCGNSNSSSSRDVVCAPEEELFIEVLRTFRAGQSPDKGYELKSGLVDKKKLVDMLWCLAEGLGDGKRDLLRKASFVQLHRDERQHRLHLRFSSVDDEFNTSRGYLGQTRNYYCDALGIADATAAVLKEFCTERACPPPCARCVPKLHQDLFDHLKNRIEAAAVDSASNETVAVTDMATMGFPNLNGFFEMPHTALAVSCKDFGSVTPS